MPWTAFRRTKTSWCALVFAACAAPRLLVLLRTPEPPPNYYWNIATSLLASGSYGFGSGVTTAIEPLYPLFLAAARLLTGDRFALAMLVQVLVASAAGALLFLLAERVTQSRASALIAAALYAFYPYYVRQSIAPHELTLSTVMLIVTPWQYSRTQNIKQAALLGGVLGLLLLLRFSFAPIWIAAIALLILRRRVREALVAAAVSVALLSPWIARTRAIDGSLAPTRVGENLFIASCKFADQVLPWYDADLMVDYAYQTVHADALANSVPPHLMERTIDDALLRRAIECIRANPVRAARLKLRNLLYSFSPLLLPVHARLRESVAHVENGQLHLLSITPRPRFDVLSHAVAHTAILAGALVGLGIRRRVLLREDAFLLAIVASIAIVCAIFFPTTRLTSPMLPVAMIYAGVGFSWIVSWFREFKKVHGSGPNA